MRSRIVGAVALAAAVIGCGKGNGAAGSPAPSGGVPAGAIPIPTATAPGTAAGYRCTGARDHHVGGMPISFAPLARRADPAVATVKARVERESASGRRRVVAEGLGTAFVYDPDGLLLTNNHVIEKASEVQVGFFDGARDAARPSWAATSTPTWPCSASTSAGCRRSRSATRTSPSASATGWSPSATPSGLQHTVSAGHPRRPRAAPTRT